MWAMDPSNGGNPYFYATTSYTVTEKVANGYDGVQVNGLMFSDNMCTSSAGSGTGTLLLGYCQPIPNSIYYMQVVASANAPPYPLPENKKLAVLKYYNTNGECLAASKVFPDIYEFATAFSINECVPTGDSESIMYKTGSMGLERCTYATSDCTGMMTQVPLPDQCANTFDAGGYSASTLSSPYPGWSPTKIMRAQSYVLSEYVDTTSQSPTGGAKGKGKTVKGKFAKAPESGMGKDGKKDPIIKKKE